ncbi:hypothetical protein GC169_03200 [bacterium]|nr:hypothetical protein [bacterium]
MSSTKAVTAPEALRTFLKVVETEAQINSEFRERLISALGVTVIYADAEDVEAANPITLAERYDEVTFKRLYGKLKAAVLKGILKRHDLASDSDLKSLKTPAMIEMLWIRATERSEHG